MSAPRTPEEPAAVLSSRLAKFVRISGCFYNNAKGRWNTDEEDEAQLARQAVTQTAKNLGPNLAEVIFISPPKKDTGLDAEAYKKHLYDPSRQPAGPPEAVGELRGMREEISSAFGVPDFFWTESHGYDANGFFNHNRPRGWESNKSKHGTMSRFLIKKMDNGEGEVGNGHKDYRYIWNYISFVTLWYSEAGDGSNATQILLCFDLPDELMVAMKEAFRKSDPKSWRHCRLGLYSIVVPVIAHTFDDALWGFRDPVRGIEKTRENHSEKMRDRYISMHELSRHVIHKVETLEVAARTLTAIVEHHKELENQKEGSEDRSCTKDGGAISPGFDFYYRFLENLGFRAQAFEKRLQNEINLASNLSGAEDQEGGRELNLIVSAATLFFLPGSFISGIFGMNFFSFDYDGIQTSKQIYIYFVTTVGATLICILIWAQREEIAKRRKSLRGAQGAKPPSSDIESARPS